MGDRRKTGRKRDDGGPFIKAASLAPGEAGRSQALAGIRQAVQEKTIYSHPSPRELLLVELRYISPGFWILQGSLVALLAALLEKTALDGGALPDYLRWISVLAAWMGVLGCSSLGRHFSRGMAELEQSCYFNLPQLWTIRMTLSGAVDILALSLGSGWIAGKTDLPFAQVSVYVLVPFVLSNVAMLLLFTVLRGGRGRYGLLVAALAAGGLAAVPGLTSGGEAYETARLWAWTAALLAGTGLYLWQLKVMYGKIRRGETICWN